MSTDHLDARLDDLDCEVYFFRAWCTYAHPVTPIDPLFLEQALQRPKYQRAWMCNDRGERRFVLLETIENTTRSIALPGGAPRTGDAAALFALKNGTELGAPLKPHEAVAAPEFVAVLPGPSATPMHVKQKVISSFHYRYKDDGRLASVTTVNPEGKVNVLEY
jgi:hypothetical protein